VFSLVEAHDGKAISLLLAKVGSVAVASPGAGSTQLSNKMEKSADVQRGAELPAKRMPNQQMQSCSKRGQGLSVNDQGVIPVCPRVLIWALVWQLRSFIIPTERWVHITGRGRPAKYRCGVWSACAQHGVCLIDCPDGAERLRQDIHHRPALSLQTDAGPLCHGLVHTLFFFQRYRIVCLANARCTPSANLNGPCMHL
jgi:hypothetical protein